MSSKITFIGGDIRMIEAARFAAKKHKEVIIYGFDKLEKNFDTYDVTIETNLKEALLGADTVIFGLPSSVDGKNLFAPYSSKDIPICSVISYIKPSAYIFGGMHKEYIQKEAETKGIKCFDYFLREELTLKNALVTAEGALQTAMTETPHTIHSSKCLVIGYGRIGKMLSDILKKLGATVTCSARKESDLALIECNAMEAVNTSLIGKSIGRFDIIFNTVPFSILEEKNLASVRHDALIIDLASKPGGVDFESARKLGLKVIWATSLPGKVAPETSGKIISDTVFNILNEQKVRR